MVVVSANLLPDREVWYHFHAVDTPDTSCDNFFVRVHFLTNPGSGYQFLVHRGSSCTSSAIDCSNSGFTDYDWKTDFRATVNGQLAGQCPCTAAGGRSSDQRLHLR